MKFKKLYVILSFFPCLPPHPDSFLREVKARQSYIFFLKEDFSPLFFIVRRPEGAHEAGNGSREQYPEPFSVLYTDGIRPS